MGLDPTYQGRLNSKLHAGKDAMGRPLRIFLTTGQRSDYIGARALLESLPEVTMPIGIAKPLQTRGSSHASRLLRPVSCLSRTIKPNVKGATKPRTALLVLGTDGESQSVTTDARRSSSQHVRSPPSSCSGYEA